MPLPDSDRDPNLGALSSVHGGVRCRGRRSEGSRTSQRVTGRVLRRELSGIRAQAEADLARRYIELQQLQDSGRLTSAASVRRFIRALEYEIVTLERLGEGLKRWL
jgi:hypothetical protein